MKSDKLLRPVIYYKNQITGKDGYEEIPQDYTPQNYCNILNQIWASHSCIHTVEYK